MCATENEKRKIRNEKRIQKNPYFFFHIFFWPNNSVGSFGAAAAIRAGFAEGGDGTDTQLSSKRFDRKYKEAS